MDSDHRNNNETLKNCEEFVNSLEHLSLNDDAVKARLCVHLSELEQLRTTVEALGLFSVNEHINEVSTAHIQFMLVPALAAKLAISHPDMQARETHLAKAKLYQEYLDELQLYEVLGDDDKRLLSVASSSAEPRVIRETKIQRFKDRKAMEQKIAHLTNMPEDQFDDEQLRQLCVTKLKWWAHQAVDDLADVATELGMLEFRKSRPPNADAPKAHASAQMPAMKPIILTRDKVQKQVFGAGYPSLPTMTVDEWYTQKTHTDSNFMAPPSNGAAAAACDPEDVEKTAAQEEKERLQQIAMDEYTDTHRRGWGNTHNKG